LDDRSLPSSASAGIERRGWLAGLSYWFRVRWRGEVPLDRIFWTDMLLIGTAVNAATTVIALFLISSDAPSVYVVAIYFTPLPLNAFLVFAVWRSAEAASTTTAFAARAVSLVWLVAATAL
jgi:hypothetical protein